MMSEKLSLRKRLNKFDKAKFRKCDIKYCFKFSEPCRIAEPFEIHFVTKTSWWKVICYRELYKIDIDMLLRI